MEGASLCGCLPLSIQTGGETLPATWQAFSPFPTSLAGDPVPAYPSLAFLALPHAWLPLHRRGLYLPTCLCGSMPSCAFPSGHLYLYLHAFLCHLFVHPSCLPACLLPTLPAAFLPLHCAHGVVVVGDMCFFREVMWEGGRAGRDMPALPFYPILWMVAREGTAKHGQA